MLKYKKQIAVGLIINLAIILLFLILIIVAVDDFKSKYFSIALLFLVLLEIPIVMHLAFSGIRAISIVLEDISHEKILNKDIEEEVQDFEDKKEESEGLQIDYNRVEEQIKGCKDIEDFGQKLLISISKQIDIVTGVFYKYVSEENIFDPISKYAYYSDIPPQSFSIGEGLNGQAVKDKKSMYIKDIPERYIKVISGLGSSQPKNILILPILHNQNVVGLLEIATFKDIDKGMLVQTDEFSEFIGSLMNKIG